MLLDRSAHRDAALDPIEAETGAIEPTAASARPAATQTVEAPAFQASPRGINLPALAVASALFMEFIDSTSLSTALPTLARDFHSDPVHLKLALTSYLLALAVFTPASGWAADRFGARRVFLVAVGVFLAGSGLCGLSRDLGQMVAARIVQGLGGAMMTPVGRLIVVGSSPRNRLVSAMGWFTTPALVGPPIAGFILSVASWPWIFYVNFPVGLIGMLAVARFVPRLRQPDPGRFDFLGFVLSALAVTGLVGMAETVGAGLIPTWGSLLLGAVAVGAGLAFVRHVRRRPKPVLDLRLLANPTFRASLTGGTLVRLGIGATPFLLPLLLQVGLGWSPLRTAWVTIFTGVGAIAAKFAIQGMIRRFGFRTILLGSAIGAAVLSAAPAAFRGWTPEALMVGVMLLGGFVRSSQFTSANTIAYADIPPDRVSAASTLSTVVQQLGLSLGVSFGALSLHLARGADGAMTADRFTVPFLLIGLTAAMAVPIYWRLNRDAGAEISGRRA